MGSPPTKLEKDKNQRTLFGFSKEKFEFYKSAYQSAKAHVYRQQHAGKHEQDKIDALKWLNKYG